MNKQYLKLKISLGISELYKDDKEPEDLLLKIKQFKKAIRQGKSKYIISKDIGSVYTQKHKANTSNGFRVKLSSKLGGSAIKRISALVPATPDNLSISAKSKLFDRPITQLENYKQSLITKEAEKQKSIFPRSITHSKYHKNSTEDSTYDYKNTLPRFSSKIQNRSVISESTNQSLISTWFNWKLIGNTKFIQERIQRRFQKFARDQISESPRIRLSEGLNKSNISITPASKYNDQIRLLQNNREFMQKNNYR